jgi:hypothetical protein
MLVLGCVGIEVDSTPYHRLQTRHGPLFTPFCLGWEEESGMVV